MERIMAEGLHSQAPHHLPVFLPGADGSDILFTVTVVSMVVLVLGFGVIYFTLHALPEKIAHGTSSTQFQLIGVLALLAMFTHNNMFWVAALLLATVKMPDFTTPLNSISRSLEEFMAREPAPLQLSPALLQPSPAPSPPSPPPMPPPEAMSEIQPEQVEPEIPEASEDAARAEGENLKPGPG
jgi:hypothetical protein